ncbi:hypothetical protein OBBRIDRAFT_758187 [Obba rivulosa]|uniref:DUF7918 domain-containing protein n=1 Tax=Obba rivulosa TaxID=1052685 RepID=A0A8E2AUL0_9APHY|nr:hypothetical protein OBBRIDRAFT_758187 [Obba rivulosa]
MYLRAWETWIYCDGEPLEEFAVKVENYNTISCYIASEAGKQFEVQWKSYLDVLASADCYMDGRCMGAGRTRPRKNGFKGYARTGPETRQPFQFASLTLTDDDDVASPDDPTTQDLGVIEVRVCRVELKYESVYRTFRPRNVESRGPVHERSKKAGLHCVSLGPELWTPQTSNTRPPDSVRYIDKSDSPYLRFIFRYRPLAHLKADRIVPLNHPMDGRPRPTVQMKAGTEKPGVLVKQEPRPTSAGPERQREIYIIEDSPPPPDYRPPLRDVNHVNRTHERDDRVDAWVNNDYDHGDANVDAWGAASHGNEHTDPWRDELSLPHARNYEGRSQRNAPSLDERLGHSREQHGYYNYSTTRDRDYDDRARDARDRRSHGYSAEDDRSHEYHRSSRDDTYDRDDRDYGQSPSGGPYRRGYDDYSHDRYEHDYGGSSRNATLDRGYDRYSTQAGDRGYDGNGSGSFNSNGYRPSLQDRLSDTVSRASYDGYMKASSSGHGYPAQSGSRTGMGYPPYREAREFIDLT